VGAQYLPYAPYSPYGVPVAAYSPYGYAFGGNRGEPSSTESKQNEQRPSGFIPNPLDPSNFNRQSPPMMPQGQNQAQSGPPAFPQPIIPIIQQEQQDSTSTPEK
jgi:hypothetical protein